MANLSYIEKDSLEKLFEMQSGYVMDFTNNSFSRFIGDSVNIDVYNGPGYKKYTSKANKLRQIWNSEPDNVVGILIEALLSHFEDMKLQEGKLTDWERKKIDEMRIVASRLKGDYHSITLPNKQEDSLQTLLEDINNALSRNKPVLALDRLHTFSTILLHGICIDNDINITDNKGNNLPLHSLAGMLKKKYEQDKLFKSTFTLMAIQNSISLFDKYNTIRNDQSYAHDNEILNTLEAEFAVRIMADFLTFIDKAELYRKKVSEKMNKQADIDDELPF